MNSIWSVFCLWIQDLIMKYHVVLYWTCMKMNLYKSVYVANHFLRLRIWTMTDKLCLQQLRYVPLNLHTFCCVMVCVGYNIVFNESIVICCLNAIELILKDIVKTTRAKTKHTQVRACALFFRHAAFVTAQYYRIHCYWHKHSSLPQSNITLYTWNFGSKHILHCFKVWALVSWIYFPSKFS